MPASNLERAIGDFFLYNRARFLTLYPLPKGLELDALSVVFLISSLCQ